MFLGTTLISWKSKKQDQVSKSSTESEYCAMFQACSEILWLHDILDELGFSQLDPTPLHVDHTSAIHITTNPVFHERTKYFEVDCPFICDAYEDKAISLPHITSDLQLADIFSFFTKALTSKRHHFLLDKLMLPDSPASI